MRTGFSLRSVLLVVAPALLGAAVFAPACASEDTPADESSDSGSGGAGGGTGGTGGGTGGTGGGENPVAADCMILCDYLESIMCDSFANCAEDCPNMLGAPPECADEFAQMLSCWVGYKRDFECTDTQVIPPEQCKEVEATFQLCFKGEVDPGECPGGILNKVGDPPTACNRKTSCGTHTYQSYCQDQGALWACSCYDVTMTDTKTLIGTCTDDIDLACDNVNGCCAPFFIP